ncbi:aminoglycoside/choline kinase family phosphotransferase [Prauserella sediminis]|uniref:Aminoglycoside/choline kinase family phosphotransferase n=1 Tax=Prauserella sediminis TaxID=577680 RepID=A0A839Y0T9_9PSEU|nr:phosphotransferase [Prauserella sediminis]MBB3665565.1 aminoglycoside/choline kinase family phosphotransferase [Prauserella sediminis]
MSLDVALSPEWLTEALNVPVHGVTIADTIGGVATKIRFTIDTEAGTHRHYCLKGLFTNEPAAAHARITRTETSFYRDLAEKVGVAVPTCRYAAVDEEQGNGVIIMEDIVEKGGRFLTALEPYTPEEARSSLRELATLHAANWGRPDGPSWLRNRLDDLAAAPLRTEAEHQDLMDDPRGDSLPGELRDAKRITACLRALADRTADQDATLVHGDAHAGNIYLLADSVALIDWQMLQRSHWSIDVAYHVGAALSVEQRRTTERDLLDHYLDHLTELGAAGVPDREQAWTDYRAAVAYGFYLWSVTRQVAPAVTREFCLRLGTAVDDLESYALLDV